MSFAPQGYVHTRAEFEVDPEPELIEVWPGLSLPVEWSEERRDAFKARWNRELYAALDQAIADDPNWSFTSGGEVIP